MENKITSSLDNISIILQKAFDRSQRANPLFSLRSLAQKADISPSYLSKVMRGLKPLTSQLLAKLDKSLNLDPIEISNLQKLLVEQIEDKLLTSKTGIKVQKEKDISQEISYKHFSKQDFFLLEKWYYIPLLNLITTQDFKNDVGFISERLGVDLREINETLRQFKHFGYIYEKDNNLLVDSDKCRFPTNRSYEQIRHFHKSMMKKAAEELDKNTSEEAFNQRLINGISFAGDPEKIKQAQNILNKAMYEVAELMSGENPQEVFQLNLQLFKISK